MVYHSKIFRSEQEAYEYADKNMFKSQYSGVIETNRGNFRIDLI